MRRESDASRRGEQRWLTAARLLGQTRATLLLLQLGAVHSQGLEAGSASMISATQSRDTPALNRQQRGTHNGTQGCALTA